jgi:hypothetical protein
VYQENLSLAPFVCLTFSSKSKTMRQFDFVLFPAEAPMSKIRVGLLLVVLGILTGFNLLAAPAPLPEAKRTIVIEEQCGGCKGSGVRRIFLGPSSNPNTPVRIVPCPYCDGTGKMAIEILPMPREE